jgi:peptide/nickel transport system substrate-binding protein
VNLVPSWRVAWRATLGVALLSFGLSSAAVAQDAPKQGGTLMIALESDLRESDALQVQNTTDKMVMGSTVYDPLFQTDEKGDPVPALATSAEASPDGMEWTFGIREGVKFQNGKTFTAEDVKKSIEAYLDPARASIMADKLANVASVTVPDAKTVKIKLKKADGRLPALFTDTVFIADMDDYQAGKPIGTGPYQWDSRVPGDRITFTRFEGHWRGVPPLDKVVFRVIADAQVAALELQSGGVDMVPTNVSVDLLPILRSDENIKIYETDGSTFYEAYLNFEKERNGGYKDALAFRQGIALLWNSEKLVPAIIGEFGSLATQVTPPWQTGADPSIGPWPYDPEKGKELLAKAGFGEGATIKLVVQNRPFLCDLATALASQLTELGYKPDIVCYQPEAFFDAVRKYDWDLLFTRVSGRPNAFQNYRDRWASNLAPTPPDDMYTLRDAHVDELIAKMGAAVDPVAYEKTGQELAQYLMREKVVVLPAYWDKVRVAARSRVHGVKVSPLVYYGFLMNMMTTVWVDSQ